MDDVPGLVVSNTLSGTVFGSVVQAGVVTVAVGPVPVLPRQLPAATPHFVGRRAELAELDGLVDGAANAVVVSAVDGTAGIGKTALALRWANAVQHRFPDGQLYADLAGFGLREPVSCAAVLDGFLTALGVQAAQVPAGLNAKCGLYRSLLHGRRVMIVLDNARDSGHVRPLLPGTAGSLVLVTSRNAMGGLVARDGAWRLPLGLLTHEDVLALLERRLGAARVARERNAALALARRCAGLPLALSIVAARAASRPDVRLGDLAEELADEDAVLDGLDLHESDVDVRTVFSWSYRALSPQVRAVFRLLGLHRSTDISGTAVASLAGQPVRRTRGQLDRLVAAGLLEQHGADRYRMHDLMRVYAAELSRSLDADDRSAALHRLFDHYVHSAWSADEQLYPYRGGTLPGGPRDGAIIDAPTDYDSALGWFTTEHATLVTAVEHAAAAGFDAHAWHLSRWLSTYLDRSGHWEDYVGVLRAAADAATRLGDRSMLAQTLRRLGRANLLRREFDEALSCCARALRIHQETGDSEGMARAYRNIAMIHQERGDYDGALANATRSRDLFRLTGNRSGEARALHALAWCGAESGQYAQALVHSRSAIGMFESLEAADHQGQASAVEVQAYVLHRTVHREECVEHYRRVIQLWRRLGNRFYEAGTLKRLGVVYRELGDVDSARDAWSRAVEIFAELGHDEAEVVRRGLADLG
ncbi:tetratricopeptide repeat protein [Actinokineospora terrae]|uniref:Predicted ATPase n=1 Tax=Actinokineospora terrae TaxID=155974 RepID=A0A1H9X9B2_9PSEU|nr:tetratricopeptide repeat protein [Actinokineospora terrae]SES42712.1 Predicted ATPase [Actinokineospora terrae]